MKKYYLFFMLMFSFITLHATHFMGGEIMWECLPNGNYRFIMNLYRECSQGAATYGNIEALNTNVPGLPTIALKLYPNAVLGKRDISPQCNSNLSFPHIYCPTYLPNVGGLEEWHYTSDENYPNGVDLPAGPIPASGWSFANTNCCRNPSTNITNATALGWYLRTLMYPHPTQSPDNCWDNSPKFTESPNSAICVGYPFSYNPGGYDSENDSLSFTWAEPLQDSPPGLPITAYASGYSYLSPLPGPAQNPNNVTATLDPFTGTLSFTSYTTGAFVIVNKVTAYHCGIKIAEVFREMQVVLLPCAGNLPPEIEPPFQNPSTGLYTEFVDTVVAGSFVDFWITALDTGMLNNGTDPQSLQISANGVQFGNGYSSTTQGCQNPPCATLNPAPPVAGVVFAAAHFQWQTDSGHLHNELPCGGSTSTYDFSISVKDDFCPAPAYQWKIIRIIVREPTLPPGPAGPISGPDTICSASGNSLEYTVPPVPNALEYHWSLPPGFTGNSTTNTIVVIPSPGALPGNISVYGSNLLGNGASSSLYINFLPVVDAGPDQQIVNGSYAVLVATATAGNEPYSFTWSNGMTNDSIVVTPLNNTSYKVTVTESGGCKNADSVLVSLVPGALIQVALPSLTSCAGPVEFPLNLNNLQDITSIRLSFSYPADRMTFSGIQNIHPLLGPTVIVADSCHHILIKWDSNTPVTASSLQAMVLKFNYYNGNASLHWDLLVPGHCRFIDVFNQNFPAGFIDGMLSPAGCATLTGDLHYGNPSLTPLNNVTINLLLNGSLFIQTITNGDGQYYFENLPAGQYTLYPQCTKAWGGVNASDALSAMKHHVGMVPLTGIRFTAADVDMSNYVNSTDALLIAMRFINMITAFMADDWVYSNNHLLISVIGNYVLSLESLCAGDADASYIPTMDGKNAQLKK